MEKRAFATPLGEVWLHGDGEAFCDRRPLLLAISGAFANVAAFDRLQSAIPEAAVLRASLPGNLAPLLADHELATCAAAFSDVVERLERPIVVCGGSLGGTVALGIVAPNLRAVVALDPPLNTASCEPLMAPFRARLQREPDNVALRDFLWTVFGVGPADRADRDHFQMVLVGRAPAIVVVGDASMPPSCVSLVGPAERVALDGLGRISMVQSLRGGHNLVVEDAPLVLQELRRALRSCAAA